MKTARSFRLALALWPLSLPALDLTPVDSFRELEGIRIPIVCFTDGARKVSYQPPTGWRLSGGGEAVTLLPPDRDGAFVRLRIGARPVAGAAETPEDFERWSRSHLPPLATDIERTGDVSGQFTLGAQPSRALTFAYKASGRRFLASVAAVEIGEKERLAIVVVAHEAAFAPIHSEAVASLFSWEWEG